MKRADGVWVAALLAGSAALFFGLLQERFVGDGAGFTNAYLEGAGKTYYNALFLPWCRLVGALAPVEPWRVPHVASAAAGVLAVPLCYPVLRGFELRPAQAGLGCALIAVTPAFLFWTTTSELHSLHLLCVALCAAVTLHGPWRRPALALGLVALLFPPLFWSHATAVLLGPAWLLLVQLGRARRAAPFRARTLLLVVGPVLFGALLLAVGASNLYRQGRFTLDPSEYLGRIDHAPEAEGSFRGGLAELMVTHGWLLPLGVVVPLAAVGAWRWSRRGGAEARRPLGALALAILPSLVFFLVVGVPERGAYFVGTLPFWIVLVLRAFPRTRWGGAAVAAALAAQAVWGVTTVARFDRGFRTEDRVEAVRAALGQRGTVLSGGDWSLPVTHFLPGVEEVSIWLVLRRFYYDPEVTPEDVARVVALGLEERVAAGPVVLDVSHRRQPENPVVAKVRPWLRALEAELERHFDTELHDHPDWPLLRLRPRPEPR